MFSRPAFLNRFLDRLPDFRALRLRLVGGAGFVATLFGLCLVLASVQLDARRCAEVARERARTLATTAGFWLDGDSHAGLGSEPGKRLDDLRATLASLLEANAYEGTVRTLRPRPENQAALAGNPGAARAGALEVVLDSAGKGGSKGADYLPIMGAAFFGGHATSEIVGSEVHAYAPVLDSWGATTAVVCVSGPAGALLWRRILFWAGSGIFAGLLVSFAVYLARRLCDRFELYLSTLESGVRQLAGGHMPSGFTLARGAPTEFARLAEALEGVRERFASQAAGQPLPPSADPALEAAQAALGEPAEFDLALLLQQLTDSARKIAQVRGLELQLVFPDGVPSHVVGHPVPLYHTLEALLRNALQSTARGRITLRVHRASDGAPGERVRFEVADTGPGVPFKDQPELAASLAEAALAAPESLQDPLQLASCLARALGGELSFESQPGQGSRFGFTAGLQLASAPTATGFHQRPPEWVPSESAFQPRRAIAAR